MHTSYLFFCDFNIINTTTVGTVKVNHNNDLQRVGLLVNGPRDRSTMTTTTSITTFWFCLTLLLFLSLSRLGLYSRPDILLSPNQLRFQSTERKDGKSKS